VELEVDLVSEADMIATNASATKMITQVVNLNQQITEFLPDLVQRYDQSIICDHQRRGNQTNNIGANNFEKIHLQKQFSIESSHFDTHLICPIFNLIWIAFLFIVCDSFTFKLNLNCLQCVGMMSLNAKTCRYKHSNALIVQMQQRVSKIEAPHTL
jgi:hypothetical protein